MEDYYDEYILFLRDDITKNRYRFHESALERIKDIPADCPKSVRMAVSDVVGFLRRTNDVIIPFYFEWLRSHKYKQLRQ